MMSSGPLTAGAERLIDARRIASHLRRRWTNGEPADAVKALKDHPDFCLDQSIVLDLAYEEFCQRVESGKTLSIQHFCAHFPSQYRGSLERLLQVHMIVHQEFAPGMPNRAATWPEPGASILGFELEREIGRGAIGRVYLAREPSVGNRLVAVKVSYGGYAEAEILGRLRHPNIVQVYSAKSDEMTGCEVICMPFLGQATLADVLDRVFFHPSCRPTAPTLLHAVNDLYGPEEDDSEAEPPTSRFLTRHTIVETVTDWGAQLADALAYAHRSGILHRDLKPTNVLVARDGRPMLLDFNLSRDERDTTPRLGGTLPYMSPEQIEATVLQCRTEAEVDARSDLFSLAVVLHEALTGQLPFGPLDPNSPLQVAAKELLRLQHTNGGKPLKVAREIDKPLALILERCLDQDPGRRVHSAEELTHLLREQLTPLRQLRRTSRRHPWLSMSVLICASACLLMTAVWIARQPAYVVREFTAGASLVAVEDYKGAIEHFNRVLAENRKHVNALVGRARAQQRLAMFDLAATDYLAAAELQPSGELAAAIGYCRNRMRHPLTAVDYYKDAIAKGVETVAVQNNLGFTYMQLGQQKEARLWLNKAIERAPNTHAALFNRAFLELQETLRDENHIPRQGIEDIQRAIEIGPDTGDQYCTAARLFALACQREGSYCDKPLEFLCSAVDRGEVLGSFRSAVELSSLLNDSRLAASLERAQGKPKGPRSDRLMPIEP